jgi:DNA-binding winged helix-turn-helix (wHTH) protein
MRYVFSDCILDTTRYVLYRAGQPVQLQPKVFQVLVYLLAQRDRVVSKQELCDQVWPGRFISDATLESTVRAVRRVLGDTWQAHRMIQTLYGHGYRFVAPVEERAESPPRVADEARYPDVDAPTVSMHDSQQTTAIPAPLPAMEGRAADAPWVIQEMASLDLASLPPAGERKLVTVLCCTLRPTSGPCAWGDLDTLHQQVQTLYELVQQEAQRYGGAVQPVLGERLLLIFGLPVAQEDHAQRAVLAALGLQQQLQQLPHANTGARTPRLSVCIGVHTGPVAVGGLNGAAPAALAVVGETVQHAVALQTAAPAGVLLCSAATARLVQRVVRLKSVAPLALAGLVPPVYQLLGRRTPCGWRAGRSLGPFVGRQQELTTLQALLAQAEAGRGQVVGIVGEPGLGKSRLLYELRHRLRGRPCTYLTSSCLSYTQATPYFPLREILQHTCGITAADPPATRRAKISRGLVAAGLPPGEVVPSLLHLLEVPVETELPAPLSPQAMRDRTIAGLVQLALAGTRRRPLVLVIENLHWCDPSSEEVLTALVERLAGAALLLLVSYRPGYRLPWVDKSYVTQVALSQLTPTDSRQVVQATLGSTSVSEALVQAIVARAGGNPFFLEELARAVGDAAAVPWRPSEVPETVQAVIAARMDRLPPAAKRLLQVAAVIGKDVPVPLLHAVAEVPEAALEQGLRHLHAAEFLEESGVVPHGCVPSGTCSSRRWRISHCSRRRGNSSISGLPRR